MIKKGPRRRREKSELSQLRREVQSLSHGIDDLKKYALQFHEQDVAAKYRAQISALKLELSLAQKGLTSGCGCPIGKCARQGSDTGSCWLLWAESHVSKRLAEIRIGELQRAATHPSRFRLAEQELESPPPDSSTATGSSDHAGQSTERGA